ncbi:MAG: hypothetical protein F6K09_37860 [Merismopedia sp. SIO2A8]|nr:hypothetical protein [Merismopedia sp. SIO2A8]
MKADIFWLYESYSKPLPIPASPRHRVTPSPHPRVTASPRHPISPSPRHRVTASPRHPISPSPHLPLSN